MILSVDLHDPAGTVLVADDEHRTVVEVSPEEFLVIEPDYARSA